MKHKHKRGEPDRIVDAIDETRIAEHFRNPDRPSANFVKSRRQQSPAVRRAKTRLRTASYRNRLDQRCAPSTNQIGMALVTALVTAKLSSITPSDRDIIGRALADLRQRGFNLREVVDALRRVRRRVVDRDEDAGNNPTVSL